MSHAANLGRLEIIKAMAALGARDFQHAFDRALLQGQIECARWLHAHGAKLEPGISHGLRAKRSMPTASVPRRSGRAVHRSSTATGSRRWRSCSGRTVGIPRASTRSSRSFARHGYELPDTPMMAFHRGRRRAARGAPAPRSALARAPVHAAAKSIRRNCGCGDDGPGMHWTPIDGTTLLHLAIDFRSARSSTGCSRAARTSTRAPTVDAEASAGTRRCSMRSCAARGAIARR